MAPDRLRLPATADAGARAAAAHVEAAVARAGARVPGRAAQPRSAVPPRGGHFPPLRPAPSPSHRVERTGPPASTVRGAALQGFFPAGLSRALQARDGTGTAPGRSAGAFPLPPSLGHLGRGGPGRPLPEAVQRSMESLFGADFSRVRIHVGPEAASLGAVAFTLGSDIYFSPGHYRPASVAGRRLLAHELTHVVQQRAGRVRSPFAGIAVIQDPALEAEAERMGSRAAAWAPAAGRTAGPRQASCAPSLQRAGAKVDEKVNFKANVSEQTAAAIPASGYMVTASFSVNGQAIAVTKSGQLVKDVENFHAEDMVVMLLHGLCQEAAAGEGKYSKVMDPAKTNEVMIALSSSPCTSESRGGLPKTSKKDIGCTEMLIFLQQKGMGPDTPLWGYGGDKKNPTFKLAFHINYDNLYQPQAAGGGMLAGGKAASLAASKAMEAAGIVVY